MMRSDIKIKELLFLIYVRVPEVGNTADTPNPPISYFPGAMRLTLRLRVR